MFGRALVTRVEASSGIAATGPSDITTNAGSAPFGAVCDDATDAAPTINAALAAIRSAPSIYGAGAGAGTIGHGARFTLPRGKGCLIKSTLNMTGLGGSGFVADLWGSVIHCQTNGTPCIDATGLAEASILGPNIYGDPTNSPSYGLVLARPTESLAVGAQHNFVDHPTIEGYYTGAAYYNRSSETTTVMHALFTNRAANAYTAIFDGSNHFAFESAFTGQTYTPDTFSSFNENLCIECEVQSFGAGSSPLWIGGTTNHRFINSYALAKGGAPAIVLYSTSTTKNSYLDLGIHTESGGTSLPSLVQFAGTLAAQTVYGLRIEDPTPGQSGPLFSRASGVTSVAIQDADLHIGAMYGTSPSWWDLAAAFSLSGRVYSQDGTYTAPGSFSGTLCVGATCNSSFTLPSSLQVSSISNAGGVSSVTATQTGGFSAGSLAPTVTFGVPNISGGQQAAGTTLLQMNSVLGIQSGGSGYAVGNLLTLQGGTCTTQPVGKVNAVDGNGAVTSWAFYTAGSCTVAPPASTAVTGGVGSGFIAAGPSYTVGSNGNATNGTVITTPGSGYTSPPPVTYSAATGGQAQKGTAVLSSSFQATAGVGSLVLDGTGTKMGVNGASGSPAIAQGALIDASGIRVGLTGNYAVPANTSLVRLTQASNVTSTMTLPTALADGQPIQFVNQGAGAVALTFSPAVRGWTNGATLAAGPGVGMRIRWDTTAAAWFREQ